jgi:hypothetical protein
LGSNARSTKREALDEKKGKQNPAPLQKEKLTRKCAEKDSLVGRAISVYWPTKNCWYDGVVESVSGQRAKGTHWVKYDDGQRWSERLVESNKGAVEKFVLH